MAFFLTSVNILDTGFLIKAKTGTQLTVSYRANLGVAMQLKGVLFDIESSCNLDKTPKAANFSAFKVPAISVNPRKISMSIYFDSKKTSTSNEWAVNDMALVPYVLQIPETQGIKALYYPVKTTAAGDTRAMASQITSILGAVDTTEPQGDISISLWDGAAEATGLNLTNVKYIPCRFETCSITQRPTSTAIVVTLEGVWTI